MLNTVHGIVREGKIELLETTELHEGTHVLVTVLEDDEDQWWLKASQVSLDAIWGNDEDDVYAELLKA